MKAHRYAVGDRVLYTERRFPHLVCLQAYTIVRCLDAKRIEPHYRIRSSLRPHDCLAAESELSREALSRKAYRERVMPDSFDAIGLASGLDVAANQNLVPWVSLPRRARHKNEQPLHSVP